ncbi:MAG TPA: dienelactone hydrolase family protein [Nocardioides sp.]|uniref:dienelactone hydrolase family protein n=1 Tax=Nocardioides sp. TaxID=35761 RepID=UPI002F4030F6
MNLIEIQTPDGPAQAYLTGHGPGVLLFMDAYGIRPQIAEMADRIASWGYTVLAPNVFHRDGSADETSPKTDLREPGAGEAFFAHAGPRIGHLTPELARRDIPAYLAALREHADGDEVGTVGYCMGARLAVRTAALDGDVVAVAGFHGAALAVEDDPESPHRLVSGTRAEYVFGHADHDRSMGPAAVERLGAALDAAGLTATNEIYPDAAHGYTMNDTAAYQEAGAERSFDELRGLLDRRLSG